jgi:ubiquinone/menaquinone biosynthesis C-methylase UbiE
MTEPPCPPWMSFTLVNIFRRMVQDPMRILRPFIREGDTVLDIGCGPGYFTIPMAFLAGPRGLVVAVDIQEEMLERTRRRAVRAGVDDRIRLHQACGTGLALNVRADFALVFWMAHEVRNLAPFFRDILGALKPEGVGLLVEPRGHVMRRRYEEILAAALAAGFQARRTAPVPLSRAAVLKPPLPPRTRAAGDTGS